MTKTEIIEEYLSIEGNKEKSLRVAIAEINSIYNVKVSVGLIQKTKVNSEHQSEQSKVNSEHQSEQSKVNSEHQSEQSKVNSEHRKAEVTLELEILLNRMGECSNLFDMTECVRQFDVYVQNTKTSVKNLLNDKMTELLEWQLKLIADYGLDERLCFTY